MTPRPLLAVSVGLACAVLPACTDERDLCSLAAEHVSECTGTYVEPSACTREEADAVLQMSCSEISGAEGKADGRGLGNGCGRFGWLPWCDGESDALDEALSEAARPGVPVEVGTCFDGPGIDVLYASAGGKGDYLIPVEDVFNYVLRPLTHIVLGIFADFPKEGGAIAAVCKQVYPGEPAARVACASRAVERYLEVRIEERDQQPSFIQTLFGINCKHFAQALVELSDDAVFSTGQTLDLPGWHPIGLRAVDLEAWGHVVNTVRFKGPEGRSYDYAVDNGWHPGVLFPLPGATCEWHRQNGFHELPAFRN